MLSAKAFFTTNPEIAIHEGSAEIHFIISGHLTHILEENCVKDTTVCDKAIITIPTKHTRSSRGLVVHDFTANVPFS